MSPFIIVFGVPFLLFLANVWHGYRNPLPPTAPRRPQAPSDAGEWIALPFQAVGVMAGLCWLAIGLAVFLAPLAALAWLVAR